MSNEVDELLKIVEARSRAAAEGAVGDGRDQEDRSFAGGPSAERIIDPEDDDGDFLLKIALRRSLGADGESRYASKLEKHQKQDKASESNKEIDVKKTEIMVARVAEPTKKAIEDPDEVLEVERIEAAAAPALVRNERDDGVPGAYAIGTAGGNGITEDVESSVSSSVVSEDLESSSGLAVAQPVESSNNLPRAVEQQTLSERTSQRRTMSDTITKRQMCLLFSCIFLLGTIAAGGIGYAIAQSKFSPNKKELNLTDSVSSEVIIAVAASDDEPYLTDEEYILGLIERHTQGMGTKDDSQTTGTPQYKALQWLLQDPGLQSYIPVRVIQRFALATFFFSTGGDTSNTTGAWPIQDNWLSYSHECNWFSKNDTEFLNPFYEYLNYSVVSAPCDSDTNELYKHLWLASNNLIGSLPGELVLLSHLETISLTQNGLTGAIPGSFSQFQDSPLSFIDLKFNSLEGALPTSLGRLKSLKHLFLSSNFLSGSLISEIGNMESLITLDVGSNDLSGWIPSEIGKMSNLVVLDGPRNSFTGQLPSQIGLLAKLRDLLLWSNPLLSGQLPSQIGNMDSVVFMNLYMMGSENANECTIPTELGTMNSLRTAFLVNMGLSSTIPSEIGALPSLAVLALQDNLLSGSIPSEIGLLSNTLSNFVVSHNGLEGSIPSTMGQLTSLMTALLRNNSFSGTLPEELTLIVTNGSLATLMISNNTMTGTIPEDLCLLGEDFSFDCQAYISIDGLCGCDCPCMD